MYVATVAEHQVLTHRFLFHNRQTLPLCTGLSTLPFELLHKSAQSETFLFDFVAKAI